MTGPTDPARGNASGDSGEGLPASLGERRRLIQRAIRDGAAQPPRGLEDVALQVAIRQMGLRWIVLLYVVGFVVEVTSLVLEDSTGARVRDALLAAVFAGLGYLQWRNGQRAVAAVERWSPPVR